MPDRHIIQLPTSEVGVAKKDRAIKVLRPSMLRLVWRVRYE